MRVNLLLVLLAGVALICVLMSVDRSAPSNHQRQQANHPLTTLHVPADATAGHAPDTVSSKPRIRVVLSAREERLPPLGIPLDPARDTCFATVLLQLSNPLNAAQKLTVKTIEIVGEPDKRVYPFPFKPQVIDLRPLENAVVDLHLAGRTGFAGTSRVKAVVHYQVGSDPMATASSEAIAIERQ